MTSPIRAATDIVGIDREVSGLVSVVVIFLDEARFLGEAVESVLAQTYDAWELLLVDDGSTDGSSELARAYAARDPARVRYLEHPSHRNLGMSASRNLGLGEARGQYVAFLDADDALYPQVLAEQVTTIEAHPEAAMVYGPSVWWYSWTGDPKDAGRDIPQPLGIAPNQLIEPPRLVSVILSSEGTNPTGPLYPARGTPRRGRLRGSVSRHVRGPGAAGEALLAVSGVRDRPVLVPLPPAGRWLLRNGGHAFPASARSLGIPALGGDAPGTARHRK